MPNEQSKLREFFKNPEEPFELSQPAGEPTTTEELPKELYNRHVRRLEKKLQEEREATIAREARLQAFEETQQMKSSIGQNEYDEMLAKIYGTDTPEKLAATELLQKAIRGHSERAKAEALDEFRKESRAQQEEEVKERNTVNSYIEEIEESHGVDLTSTDEARAKQQEFRDLWFKFSPKDKNGEVIEYADPEAVWEIFSQRQTGNRAQTLASRSMTRSTPVEQSAGDSAELRWLKEQGILDSF